MSDINKKVTWLDKLNEQLSKISDAEANDAAPSTKPCPHEHIVGVLTPDLKKIRYLSIQYKDLAKKAMIDTLSLPPQEQKMKRDEIQHYENEFKVISEIFWASCHHIFPILNSKENIGIREGWKVVWSEHSPEEVVLEPLIKAALEVSKLCEEIKKAYANTKH